MIQERDHMTTQRRKFTAEFKARVVIEMLTEQKSAAQSSREYGIKDSVLSRWKQEFIERSPMLFEQGNAGPDDRDQRIAELERMVGRLALELDLAKKVSRHLNSSRGGSGSW
jgi:transposase